MVTQAVNHSVQGTGPETWGLDSLVISIAGIADDIIPWGRNVPDRDKELRAFWPTEPILASAIFNISGRDAAFSWTLDGPPQSVGTVQKLLHEANFGEGWLDFVEKIRQDILTQDNGAFIEVIRSADSPSAPVVGIASLDAARCIRTRDRENPVIYTDEYGKRHYMKWYQVIRWSEFPSPIQTMRGVQYCAVTRCLRAAQLLRDISVYQREKVGGNAPDAIHLVSGVSTATVNDAIGEHRENITAEGFTRYIKPVIIASLDPTASVSHETIPVKSLPDGFDIDTAMRWYINQLALAFGADYQDFAPLPGRSLGSSTQSLVLHEKSRGKGPELFMKGLEHKLNFHGVLPRNVTFMFDEQDVAADEQQAQLALTRAQRRQIYVMQGILPVSAIQQQMLDTGELSQEEFDAIQAIQAETGVGDITPDVTVSDDESLENKATKDEVQNRPAFLEEERLRREEQIQAGLARIFSRHLADIKKRINPAKALGFSYKQGDDPVGVFEDEAMWASIRDEMKGVMGAAAQDAALEAARAVSEMGLGVDMEGVNQAVLDFTRTYTDEWWDGIEAVSRQNLRTALTNWQQSGLGERGLSDLIKAIEPTFGRARAENIAVTETTRLFDLGTNLANVTAGIEEEEWQTARDEPVCPICRPLDKNRYPVTEGPRPVSDTHPRCRCQRLPVGYGE